IEDLPRSRRTIHRAHPRTGRRVSRDRDVLGASRLLENLQQARCLAVQTVVVLDDLPAPAPDLFTQSRVVDEERELLDPFVWRAREQAALALADEAHVIADRRAHAGDTDCHVGHHLEAHLSPGPRVSDEGIDANVEALIVRNLA